MAQQEKSACQCRRHGFDPWVGTIPWRREWLPTPVFLPRKSHGQEEPGGLQPMGSQKSETQLSDQTTMTQACGAIKLSILI